jgi:hypothetical protein
VPPARYELECRFEIVLYNITYSGALRGLPTMKHDFGQRRSDSLRHRIAWFVATHILEKKLTTEIRPFLVPLVRVCPSEEVINYEETR